MLRRLDNFMLLLCLVSLLLACQEKPAGSETTIDVLPNIVYILADDLGYGDIAVYHAASKIQTPHLDRLAAEGMRLTDAHAPSSVCTPTRYGILTGQYCWRSALPRGVLRGYGRAILDRDRTTVADLLQQQGYRTGVIGKWHLGLDWVLKAEYPDAFEAESTQKNELGVVTTMDPDFIDFTQPPTDGPLQHGFDYSFILPASLDMQPYCYLENDQLTAIPSEHTEGNDLHTGYTGAFWRPGRIAPNFAIDSVLPTFTEKAINFIETNAPAEAPFFLYLPLAAPHTPWLPESSFIGGEAGAYGDFVSMVDAMVGRILHALSETAIADNTLVIFTSDNGPYWPPRMIEEFRHRAAGHLRGMKADAWEGGHRVPYIARWPGKIAAGSQSDVPTSLTHLLATCAQLTSTALKPDEGEDSHSILPILLGQADTIAGQTGIVHHSSQGFFAVRSGDWKLIFGRGSGGFSQPVFYEPKAGEPAGQLYRISEDPEETNNVYNSHPEQVARLSELLEQMQTSGRSR